MQVLFIAQQFDYGDPSRGLSFEHYSFHDTLCAMGLDVQTFDYPTLIDRHGKAETNRRLWQAVQRDKPAVLFGVVRRDQIDRRVMRRISEQTDTVTINWFCDDHWQFESHARAWTPCFNHVVTTSQTALANYERCGLGNVIKSQWGANTHLYRPTPGEPVFDVTFVGQPYGVRREAVEALRKAGVRVATWGNGWPGGKLDQREMIRVFGQSRVNLNFADASSSVRTRIETFAASHAVQSLRDKPVLWRAWDAAQRAARWDKRRAERRAEPPPRQIKGRVFEVPACGGLLLTQPAEDLADYLEPGRECELFETTEELVETTRALLADETRRRSIAEAGYRRVVRDHRWEQRLAAVFDRAGVPVSMPEQDTVWPAAGAAGSALMMRGAA